MEKIKMQIVKRTEPNGNIYFVIQYIGIWGDWVDHQFYGSCRIPDGTLASFDSLDESKRNLCHFDGTEINDETVYETVYRY